MPSPLNAILLLFAIFSTLFLFSFSVNAIYVFKNKDIKNEAPPENPQENKVYYIEKIKKAPKRSRKKPDIALKGRIISSEHLKQIIKDEDLFK